MKKTTILINGMPFTYNDELEDISYDNIDAISEEDAIKLLSLTKELFYQCGIRFGLCFGTLLGAVRDKGLIKGDEDVDVFVESEEKLRSSLPFLYEHGLKVCRIREHRLYSFHVDNKSFIDVYIKEKLPTSVWSFWCYSLDGDAVPKWYLSKFDKIEFLGLELLCPHKPERLLAFWYGKTWRVPVKGHEFSYELSSRLWWKTKGKSYYATFSYLVNLFFTRPHIFLGKAIKRVIIFF